MSFAEDYFSFNISKIKYTDSSENNFHYSLFIIIIRLKENVKHNLFIIS